jgi:hypothetical protein
VYIYDRLLLFTTRNVSNKNCGEKKNAMFNNFFFPENCAVYDTMWKHVVDPERPKMAIRRTSNACWISKATDTHSEYEILIAIPRQQWLHKYA